MTALIRLLGFDLAPIQNVDSIRFSLGWGWAGLVLAAIIVLPWFWGAYRFEGKPGSNLLKGSLMGLRLLLVLGIIALLAGFKCSVSGWIPQKNKIAVLIDTSRSMSIKEEGVLRMDSVRKQLTEVQFLTKLERNLGIPPSLFSFAGTVAPIARDDIASFSLQPDGTQTNLTKAVLDVVNNMGEGNLLGVVLFTDGCHNHGESPMEALTRLKTPLFFAGTGQTGQTKDLGISFERPPSVGYLNAVTRVRGEIKLHRVATESVNVEVRRGGKPFQTLRVPIVAGEQRASFALNIPCETEGSFNFTASVPLLDGELTHENNETSFLLKVVKERLKILGVFGDSCWDAAFLKSALKSDPNAHFNGWTRLNDNRWMKTVDFKLGKPEPAPKLGEDLDDSDVLVIGGAPESLFRDSAEKILERVRTGKLGVLFLPAPYGYQYLGYQDSKLSPLFPVELAGESWVRTPVNFILPVQETPYGFLRLMDDPVENMEFFRLLPKMEGLFVYDRVKPGTEVLLSSSYSGKSGPAPAYVQHRFGQGNSAMFMTGPLWPMGFTLAPTDRTIKPYTAFLLNSLKWLANRKEDALVSLELPSSRGFVGQPSSLRVWVWDTRRQPVDPAQVSATISGKDVEPFTLTFMGTSEKGCYEGTFVPSRRGVFEVAVTAKQHGKLLGETKGQFLVDIPTVEFDDPEVRIELMTKLASSTGGAFRPVESSEDILGIIKPTPGQKRETKIFEFRDSAMVLALLLLLPLVEWVLRRSKGYS